MVTLTQAKTKAGIRDIPIHPAIRDLLEQRCADSNNGYVFDELTATKYGARSNAAGKRFSTLKSRMGYDKRYNLHSLRRTVATALEVENVVQDILGHKKRGISFGHYSSAQLVDLKIEALVKSLVYPEKVVGRKRQPKGSDA